MLGEAIAAMLVADLDIPEPEPLLVKCDMEFVELVRIMDPDVGKRANGNIVVSVAAPAAKADATTLAIPIFKYLTAT